MEEALKQQSRQTCKDVSIAVQGFGNVGSHFAQIAYEHGAKVVAISGAHGGVYNPEGLDIPKVQNYIAKHSKKMMDCCPSVESITNKELLALNVDVLAPCAIENQITADNADNVMAKLVVEGANGPTTPTADEILIEKKIFVVPDILANAGGVIVSYFEWVQSLQSFFWKKQQVNEALSNILVETYAEVNKMKRKYQLKNSRTAAMALAVDRIAQAINLRGIFP